ncbi:MAG: sulfotransferase [Calditrichaeota bacterium]|nr:sulfotransferase [Calditrichota bacterium]MCB0267700.1 sulfotransferase [Calditrichota bacterium]MCB0299764.1 sulfotransferase [Calditrichota bacterium]
METVLNLERALKAEKIREIKDSAPVFVIGSHRSGTSFLYRLIQKYLKIGFGRDNGLFVRKMKMLNYYGDLKNDANLRRLLTDILNEPDVKRRFPGLEIDVDVFISQMDERTYPELVRRFYAEWAYLKGANRWGGKTPDYSVYTAELLQLFPDAKFVHIIRDGRDVALSLFRLDWGAKSPIVAAKHWKERVEAACNFGRTLDDSQYLEIRYEHLVQFPEEIFENLIHFLDWEDDRYKIIDQFNRGIVGKVRRDNFNKWKTQMSRRHIRLFEQVAGKLLQNLNYKTIFSDEEISQPLTKTQLAVDYLENILRKLLMGQGFKGLFVRSGKWMRKSIVKLRFLLNSTSKALRIN